MAALLLATAVAAISSMVLAFVPQTKTTKFRKDSVLLAQALNDELSNYVAENRDVVENPPGNPAWHLPGDACGDTCGMNCWALAACVHDITSWLPVRFRTDYAATASYEVTIVNTNGAMIRNISIHLDDNSSQTK